MNNNIEVHIFCLKLAAGELLQAEEILQEDERRRAAVMRPEPRARFISGRAGLRRFLGERLGRTPSEIAFCYGDRGKPSLRGEELSFSMAHSGDWATVALAPDGAAPIGIDLELERSVEEGVHDLVLHPEEKAMLTAMSPMERCAAFLDVWVTKEAVLKASGLGLHVMPNTFQTWGLSHLATAPGLPDGVALTRLPVCDVLRNMGEGRVRAVSALAFGSKGESLTCRLQVQGHPMLGESVLSARTILAGQPLN